MELAGPLLACVVFYLSENEAEGSEVLRWLSPSVVKAFNFVVKDLAFNFDFLSSHWFDTSVEGGYTLLTVSDLNI